MKRYVHKGHTAHFSRNSNYHYLIANNLQCAHARQRSHVFNFYPTHLTGFITYLYVFGQ
jgi:hypothetical protein